jgi:F0F1-type ATP synthase membrane subunit a
MPALRSHPAAVIAATLGLTLALALCLLALPDAADAALQKLAGYQRGGSNRFGQLYDYLSNLRDAIVPLAIPVGAIGMVVGGGMYLFGNPHAGRILFGVVVGLGLILLAPSIVA